MDLTTNTPPPLAHTHTDTHKHTHTRYLHGPMFHCSFFHMKDNQPIYWALTIAAVKESESHSVVSNSLRPHRLDNTWNSPGQNTGVSSLSLFQGIFPTQGLNPGLPQCRWILYQLRHKGSPRILECPSRGDLSDPGIEPESPALQTDSLSTEPSGKPISGSSVNVYCIFSILFPRSWITFTVIILNSFSGRLLISTSFRYFSWILSYPFIILYPFILINFLWWWFSFWLLQDCSSCFFCLPSGGGG